MTGEVNEVLGRGEFACGFRRYTHRVSEGAATAAGHHALGLTPSAMSLSPSDQYSSDPEEDRWFAQEVERHSPSLKSYLQGLFPSIHDIDDIVQESFLRLWKVSAQQPVRSARALVFRIGRNLALDHLRRSRISPVDAVGDLEALGVSDDRDNVVAFVSNREKARILAEAIDSLPARCREVVVLRKLKGMPQRAVAKSLGLSEKTVEAHLSRGIKRCEDYLKKRGWRRYFDV